MNPHDPTETIDEESRLQTHLLLKAIDAFTRSESWIEAKQVVEQHRELLTDEAEALLDVLIARQSDQRAVNILLEHRQLLTHCRDVGIDAAFADRIAGRNLAPPGIDPTLWLSVQRAESYQALLALVFEHPELMPVIKEQVARVLGSSQMAIVNAIEVFLRVSSWDEAQVAIEQHPELLTMDADIWLLQYADFMRAQGNADIAEIVGNRRWLLARCRLYGVSQVFQRNEAIDGVRLNMSPELMTRILST
ncbi:MAG: hypothetical protein JXA21_22650 [Anaerolineae bacterium]|nr:hypothetical protein [Anaerolineae bacterium]